MSNIFESSSVGCQDIHFHPSSILQQEKTKGALSSISFHVKYLFLIGKKGAFADVAVKCSHPSGSGPICNVNEFCNLDTIQQQHTIITLHGEIREDKYEDLLHTQIYSHRR